MSIGLIIILVLSAIALAGVIYYFASSTVVLMGEPGIGESHFVPNPAQVEHTVRTRGNKSYKARLKTGRKGISYHDFDYFDELDNLLYDIFLMQSLFEFIEGGDYEEGYFELNDESSEQEYVAEEGPAQEYVAEEEIAVEEEPAQEYLAEEEPATEVAVEEEPAQEYVTPEAPAQEYVAPEAPAQEYVAPETETKRSYSEPSYSSSSSDYGSSDSGSSDSGGSDD